RPVRWNRGRRSRRRCGDERPMVEKPAPGLRQPHLQGHLGLVAEGASGLGYVAVSRHNLAGSPRGVTHFDWPVRTDHPAHLFEQGGNRRRKAGPELEYAGGIGLDCLQDAVAHVVYKYEVSYLTAVAIDGNRMPRENLTKESCDGASLVTRVGPVHVGK